MFRRPFYDREAPVQPPLQPPLKKLLEPLSQPVFQPIFQQPLERPQPPSCRCFTLIQLYLCGCPDQGWDKNGYPIPSVHKCEVHWLPWIVQAVFNALGFKHNDDKPPHSPEIRVLPFPCFKHQEQAKTYITPQKLEEAKARALDRKENRIQAEKLNKRIKEILDMARERRTIEGSRKLTTRLMREARLSERMREARPRPFGIDDSNSSDSGDGGDDSDDSDSSGGSDDTYSSLNSFSSFDGFDSDSSDDMWECVREEHSVDLYKLDAAPLARATWARPPRALWDNGNPFYPMYEQPANRGYDGGAYALNDLVIRQAQHNNWYHKDPQETWRKHATTDPTLLHM
ncbi:hypothetical protein B0T24DRAFT_699028 [Lasiosphaeria ovina]|uniref:Uncharacterized protein n=1 Tax=Lasiosphaeria ovina TaxID=92902 RepID=A0AAE0KG19_9PEZI|nr:hypothetical protein B0T24DRAFT_699028 [Lasiosphaeria ovina]